MAFNDRFFGILAIACLVFPSLGEAAQGADGNDQQGVGPEQMQLQRTLRRAFPLETIWAEVVLNLDLPPEKIVQLRQAFQPYWDHRNQILQTATEADRRSVRERVQILRQRLKTELGKHLTPEQMETALTPANNVRSQERNPKAVIYGKQRRVGDLQVGDDAPDFRLQSADGNGVVQLSAFEGNRDVVLIFGSYT